MTRPGRVALLLLLLAPGLVRATDPTPEKTAEESAVRAADARRIEAMVQGDTKALAPLLAPGLTYVHSSGDLENREHFLETIGTGRLDYVSLVPSDVAVRVLGNTAVITGKADVKLVFQGKENALVLRFTSVWFKSPDAGWQMLAWQSTRLP
ncbi:MAG: nuclear transport factor 2 family protein [Acidobacteriota bacterium]